jgi:hypothetical protein
VQPYTHSSTSSSPSQLLTHSSTQSPGQPATHPPIKFPAQPLALVHSATHPFATHSPGLISFCSLTLLPTHAHSPVYQLNVNLLFTNSLVYSLSLPRTHLLNSIIHPVTHPISCSLFLFPLGLMTYVYHYGLFAKGA